MCRNFQRDLISLFFVFFLWEIGDKVLTEDRVKYTLCISDANYFLLLLFSGDFGTNFPSRRHQFFFFFKWHFFKIIFKPACTPTSHTVHTWNLKLQKRLWNETPVQRCTARLTLSQSPSALRIEGKCYILCSHHSLLKSHTQQNTLPNVFMSSLHLHQSWTSDLLPVNFVFCCCIKFRIIIYLQKSGKPIKHEMYCLCAVFDWV